MLALKALSGTKEAAHQHIHTRDTQLALPGTLCSTSPSTPSQMQPGHFWKDPPLHLLGVSIRQLQASPTDCQGPGICLPAASPGTKQVPA